jgi:3-hydroxyisobutyrate dehydrogenase
MVEKPVVAVIGLGAMGHAFAANLLKNGFTTWVWNRNPAKASDLLAMGALQGNTPAQAVSQADIIITMLSDGAVTQSVFSAPDGLLSQARKGAVLVQMATLGIDATNALIALTAEQRPDLSFIDAPVSGTKAPAEQAQILILASGDVSVQPRLDAVFSAIAKGVRWLGEAGAGTRMKLVVNAWLISMMQGIAESAHLAKQLGFSADDFWHALDGGPLASPYVKGKLAMIQQEDYPPQMQLKWALKDINLALDAADGINLPVMQLISRNWQNAVDQGLAEQDLSVVYQALTQNP